MGESCQINWLHLLSRLNSLNSHIRTERAEKVKEEKDKFCKEALAAKQKRERAAKQGHKK